MKKLTDYHQISSLWLDYKEGLRNYILKQVKDIDNANELTHEVLMKVYKSCCSDREIRNIKSWLYQIAYHTSVDYLRKQNKLTHEIPERWEEREDDIYEEAAEWIKPLIQLLPEEYATPLRLSDLEGIPQAEVAEQLQLSLTATKSRIQRARKKLKGLIVECFDVETNEQGHLTGLEVKPSCTPLQNGSEQVADCGDSKCCWKV